MEKKITKTPEATREALIGLIGTILTICGGLTTTGVGAAVTLYLVEQKTHQVDLVPPESDQALTVDLQQIPIPREEADQLDPDEYANTSDLGLVLAQPRAGWSQIEEMTYYDLFFEEAALSPLILFSSWIGSAWDEQPVCRIRYGEPVQIQYQEGTTENGTPIDLETLRSLIGGDTISHYSQITVLAIDKETATDYTLAGIALTWGALHRGGVNHIVASEESQYILLQATWLLQDVRVDGQKIDLPIERWALFADGPQRYYVVELNYVPSESQPAQVWDDLKAYMDSFRVIQ